MNPELARELKLIKKRLDDLEQNRREVALGLSLMAVAPTGANPSVAIPVTSQSYRHLLLMGSVRSSVAAENDGLLMQFNGDTGSNYDWQRMSVNNATLSGAVGRATTSIQVAAIEGDSSRANSFSPVLAYIYLYNQAAVYEKYTMSYNTFFGDVSADADMFLQLRGGRWRSTAAITSITLLPSTGPNFVSGSGFQLYGVR